MAGCATTGAGLRAWGLAAGLAARGLDVTLAAPNTALDLPEGERAVDVYPDGPRLRVAAFERGALTEFVRERDPDAVVMQHWGLMNDLASCAAPLAIDLAGPHLLERLYWNSPNPNANLLEKIDALGRADLVTCSGRWQRHYFLPYLQMAGWRVTDDDACPVIPFSYSPRLPEPSTDRDPARFVYGGMFLPWQDPEPALRASLEAMDSAGAGSLDLFGGPHPSGDVSDGRFAELWREMESHERVSTHGVAPFDELLAHYSRCGVALDLMPRNPERELAFTTRTVVYLACGLPVIHNDYSELSAEIVKREAGWALDPSDSSALRELVERLLREPELIAKRGANARRWVAGELNWERTIEPLTRFCADPRPRVEKESARLAWESQPRRVAELEAELASTRSTLETLRGKWIVRAYERRARWSWLLIPVVAPLVAIGAAVAFVGGMFTRRKAVTAIDDRRSTIDD